MIIGVLLIAGFLLYSGSIFPLFFGFSHAKAGCLKPKFFVSAPEFF